MHFLNDKTVPFSDPKCTFGRFGFFFKPLHPQFTALTFHHYITGPDTESFFTHLLGYVRSRFSTVKMLLNLNLVHPTESSTNQKTWPVRSAVVFKSKKVQSAAMDCLCLRLTEVLIQSTRLMICLLISRLSCEFRKGVQMRGSVFTFWIWDWHFWDNRVFSGVVGSQP